MASAQTSPLTARREELSRNTELYKQAIEDQVSNLKQDAGKVGRVALGVGGAALATYLVSRAVKSRKTKRKQKQVSQSASYMHPYQIAAASYAPMAATAPVKTVPKVASPVSSLIKQQITLFLGAVARQAVKKAIERIGKNDNQRIQPTYHP